MMIVRIADRAEWDRVLAARNPSPRYVGGDAEWFHNGRGTRFAYEVEADVRNVDDRRRLS